MISRRSQARWDMIWYVLTSCPNHLNWSIFLFFRSLHGAHECRNVDWPVNWKPCKAFITTDRHNVRRPNPPVHLRLRRPLTPEHDNVILKLLHMGRHLVVCDMQLFSNLLVNACLRLERISTKILLVPDATWFQKSVRILKLLQSGPSFQSPRNLNILVMTFWTLRVNSVTSQVKSSFAPEITSSCAPLTVPSKLN